MQKTWNSGSILGWEDPLEEGMATHSSIPAWRIPWTEEPSRLQSIGLQRVKHYWNDLACLQYVCSNATLSIRPTLSSCYVHKSGLYVCISTAALQISSSVPFFKTPYICINIFSLWLTSFCITVSMFIHFTRTNWKFIPFCVWIIFHHMYVPQLLYLFFCWWASMLLPCPGYCK